MGFPVGVTANIGELALGCHSCSVGGSSMGWIKDASFAVTSPMKNIMAGYPKKVQVAIADSIGLTASVTSQEFNCVSGLLGTIAGDIDTGTLSSMAVSMGVFRPRGGDLTVSLDGMALLPEFSLSFGNDFNSATFSFESIFGTDETLADKLSVTAASTTTTKVTNPLAVADGSGVSIGFPAISGFFSIQGAVLNLTSTYHRVEVGYPKKLIGLIPLSQELSLEVQSESLNATDLESGDITGQAVSLVVPLYGGGTVTLTLNGSQLVPETKTKFTPADFSTVTKKFIATGDSLLTVS